MAPKSEFVEIAYKRAIEKKTHVSFPQLKYPSLRDKGFRDPVQWLMGKAMDDGAEGLWRVHNGLYDLNEFIDQHPGGGEWLELSKGTDITEAFESHHFGPTAEKMLTKYYVRDAKVPRNSPFTFKEDGFFRNLKKDVYEILKTVPNHVKTRADRIIDGLFVTLLISSALACWAKDYWVVMASYLVASICLAWVTVAAHNYIHRRTNWRMYLFNFSMWSYRDFRVSHALSHHLYPNTLIDLEISGFEPLVFWNPRKDVPFFANFGFIIEQFIHPFLFLKNFLTRFLFNFTRKDFFKNHYRWHDGLGLLLPVWMWLASGVTFYEAFTMWLWINCTGSWIFFTIGANAAHHHPKLFKDGDEPYDTTRDWGLHEMETVMDRVDINRSLFRVMTFFGDHCLHHLFPTIDHAVLPHLYPALLKNVEKFKGQYNVSNSFEMVIAQIQQTLKKEPTLLADRGINK